MENGLPNDCAILQMLDEYVYKTTYHHAERNLLDHSNAGT